MASKYVVETGPGYLGVYRTFSNSVAISYGAWPQINWRSDTHNVVAVDAEGIPGYQLVATCDLEDEDLVCDCLVPKVLEALDGFEPGEEIRVYDYDDGRGLTVVPADPDPMLSEDL